MKREIEDYFINWKNSYKRKPLILRGARQVGKTFIVDKFAHENFKYYLKINLEQNSDLLTIFETNNPERIINDLTILFQIPIVDNQTLIFIDEIQCSPKAIASLRYFYEQKPDLHIIAAGSQLDHTLNEIQYSMPVGRVEFAYMYPLTFKEFLWAMNENAIVNLIENFSLENSISIAIHNKISELLRLYFFIGGMPEAVDNYINTKNLLNIEKIHSNIITSIQYDFAKYGTRKQQEFLKDVLNYVVNNIGRKVKYMNINKNAPSVLLKDSFLKLEMSRIIHLIRYTNSTNIPITQYQDNDVFKPVFFDIGLVNHLAKIKLTDIQNLVTDFEGALAEQFVFQELIVGNEIFSEQKLNYWSRDAKNSNAEIDCLYQIENKIFPLEIKAGKRGTLKSLHIFLAEKNKNLGIRLNLDLPTYGQNLEANINLQDIKTLNYQLLSLPIYFARNLKNIIKRLEFE